LNGCATAKRDAVHMFASRAQLGARHTHETALALGWRSSENRKAGRREDQRDLIFLYDVERPKNKKPSRLPAFLVRQTPPAEEDTMS